MLTNVPDGTCAFDYQLTCTCIYSPTQESTYMDIYAHTCACRHLHYHHQHTRTCNLHDVQAGTYARACRPRCVRVATCMDMPVQACTSVKMQGHVCACMCLPVFCVRRPRRTSQQYIHLFELFDRHTGNGNANWKCLVVQWCGGRLCLLYTSDAADE